MKLSEYLDSCHGKLPADCLDVDLDSDNGFFLSLERIYASAMPIGRRCAAALEAYQSDLASEISSGCINSKNGYFSIGKENNYTKLGLSRKEPKGNGCSVDLLVNSVNQIKHLIAGTVRHPLHAITFLADGVDRDRTSDLVVGIILKYLCEYTLDMLSDSGAVGISLKRVEIRSYEPLLHAISMNPSFELPLYNGLPFIIVPKEFVDNHSIRPARRFLFDAVLASMIAIGTMPIDPKTGKPYSRTRYRTEVCSDQSTKSLNRNAVDSDPSLVDEYVERAYLSDDLK